MNDESPPIACSLGADDLRRRLAEIAALGNECLRGRTTEGDAQVLRFHPDPSTRRRLEQIVAAESECCAFLDLDLRQEGDELVLTISAPADAALVAADLAQAFANLP